MIKDLDVILNEGESYSVEFKMSAAKSLPAEVCAFANAPLRTLCDEALK